MSQGSPFGEWVLYVMKGKLEFTFNYLGLKSYAVSSFKKLPKETTTIKVDFAYNGGGNGKGGDVNIYIDGKKVEEARVEKTHPYLFSANETADVRLNNLG